MLDPGRGRTATGRLRVYAVDDRASGAATPPLVRYRFTTGRSGVHPQIELAEFTGALQADAYCGYDKLYKSGRVTEIACWAHFRRQIFDVHQPQPTALSVDLLERIGALYAIEKGIRGQPPAVGRRIWLFIDSPTSGMRAAAIYTVIETCKANSIDPQAYIADVTAKIAAGWPAAHWDDIMPWNWRPADQPVLAQTA